MVLLKELLFPRLHFLLFLHLLPEAHLHFMGELTCPAQVMGETLDPSKSMLTFFWFDFLQRLSDVTTSTHPMSLTFGQSLFPTL